MFTGNQLQIQEAQLEPNSKLVQVSDYSPCNNTSLASTLPSMVQDFWDMFEGRSLLDTCYDGDDSQILELPLVKDLDFDGTRRLDEFKIGVTESELQGQQREENIDPFPATAKFYYVAITIILAANTLPTILTTNCLHILINTQLQPTPSKGVRNHLTFQTSLQPYDTAQCSKTCCLTLKGAACY
ncbi:hypothetical protein BYT27DRAFT_7208549 [Phlegmacium glaucopus]|nr:hypothetical protein BYT27DRAFT_7208549 [Phlegmacium glaucopus]